MFLSITHDLVFDLAFALGETQMKMGVLLMLLVLAMFYLLNIALLYSSWNNLSSYILRMLCPFLYIVYLQNTSHQCRAGAAMPDASRSQAGDINVWTTHVKGTKWRPRWQKMSALPKAFKLNFSKRLCWSNKMYIPARFGLRVTCLQSLIYKTEK